MKSLQALSTFLILGLGSVAMAEARLSTTYVLCTGGNCLSTTYPGSGGAVPGGGGAPGGGAIVLGNPAPWTPPTGIFTGVKGDPKLDEALHKALFSAATSGQSPETAAQFRALNEALDRYGSAPAATTGITREYFETFRKQVEAATNLPAQLSLPPLPPGPSFRDPALNASLARLRDSAFRRDPFAMVDGIDAVVEASSGARRRGSRVAVRDALVGRFTDGDGVILLPTVSSPAKLVTPWRSPEGRRVRHGLGTLLAAQEFFEAGYSARCEAGGEECRRLGETMIRARQRFLDVAVAYVFADRIAFQGQNDLFALEMPALDAFTSFAAGAAKGFVGAGTEFVSALGQLVAHPIVTGGRLVSGLTYAMVHYDDTYAQLKQVVGTSVDTILFGTAEQRGELAGKIAFNLVAGYVGGEAISAGGSLITQAAGRALTYAGLEEVTVAAVKAGQMSLRAKNAFLDVAAAVPETGRVLWTKARTRLSGLGTRGSLSGEAAIQAGMGDGALAKLATANPGEAISILERQGLERAALNATYRDAFNLTPEQAAFFSEPRPARWLREPAWVANAREKEVLVRAGVPEDKVIKSFQDMAYVGERKVPKPLDVVVASFREPVRVNRISRFNPVEDLALAAKEGRAPMRVSNWVMRTDPTALTPAEVAHYFGLPQGSQAATYILEIEIPAGTPMLGGIGATLSEGTGPVQWKVLMKNNAIPHEWIKGVHRWNAPK